MPKKIETIAVSELFDRASDGNIPVLVDIQHDDIIWADTDEENAEQENGHLRLINNNAKVKYDGHYYWPAYFSFTLPSEDGKKIGSTSITISAVDQRVIEIIRSINSKPTCVLEAFYSKMNESQIIFSKLYHYQFVMDQVTWDGITAKWNLVFDPTMQLNVPRDLANVNRCPAVNQNNN